MRKSRSAYGLELTCAHMRPSSACDYRRPATHEELIMTTFPYRTALIVGAGSGISASVARGLATAGLKVGVAARDVDKLAALAAGTRAGKVTGDASDPAGVAHLFAEVDTRLGVADVVVHKCRAREH